MTAFVYEWERYLEGKVQILGISVDPPQEGKKLLERVTRDCKEDRPQIPLDPDQIQNVVTNLVLNAREAIGERGRIRIQTARQNGWAVLTVSDDGCGMTPEFLRQSLFRPFQTTKKGGTGIGMFQCKMIVEAHHGRIEVESEPGKGTSFRVLLPLPQT